VLAVCTFCFVVVTSDITTPPRYAFLTVFYEFSVNQADKNIHLVFIHPKNSYSIFKYFSKQTPSFLSVPSSTAS
ncbi:hypothetical protein, partial [Klebsiella pneumoniae]|uniref:hypothetical protein n=1 Tax=Klebsiella pneumoniae TaxID=573 RepID=UPI003B986E16